MAKRARKPSHNTEPSLAFESNRFMESGDARALRILAEYLEPQTRLRRARVDNTVVFFGSARLVPQEEAERALHELESQNHTSKSPAAQTALKSALMAVEMAR